MKKANIYRLIILFSNGSIWDLKVLAINTEVISLLFPRDETPNKYVKKTTIEMIEFESENVEQSFLCKVLD